ncbi:fk506-binding protein 5 [Gigaspora margarita]|uniref:Fk506-binding protein 5 n=1 Tax=Gigaspora margarita TaxID=4874 RepID=A0A8H4B1P1_GIGMA|nr:fk506-binding protein 5 [Gigaspora margarita]
MKLFFKFTFPNLQFQFSPPPQKNSVETLYPSLSRAATARGAAARHSIMSTESNNEVGSWSSLDDPVPVDVKEIIPLTAICPEQELHRAAFKILQQGIDFLKNLPNDECYVFESKFVPSSTIGKHVRHMYDHFRLLLESKPLVLKRASVEDDSNNIEYNDYDSVETLNESHNWNVDYDNRQHNVPIDSSRSAAIGQLSKLQSTILSDCTSIPLNTIIDVSAIIDVEMLNSPVTLQSTYGRELWFCCHHAFHHYALIKAICIEQNIPYPQDFGIAPSTIKNIGLSGNFVDK